MRRFPVKRALFSVTIGLVITYKSRGHYQHICARECVCFCLIDARFETLWNDITDTTIKCTNNHLFNKIHIL